MYQFDNTLIEAKLKEMDIGPVVAADKLKCASHMTIRKWIEGYCPRVDALVEFCNVFSIDITEFFYQDGHQISQTIQEKNDIHLKRIPEKEDNLRLKLSEYLEVQKTTREETRKEMVQEIQRISEFYERQLHAKEDMIQDLHRQNAELKAHIDYISTKTTYPINGLSESQTLYTKK